MANVAWLMLVSFIGGCSGTNGSGSGTGGGNGQDSRAVGKTFHQVELLPLGYQTADAVDEQDILQALPPKVTLLHFWGTWCPPCRAEYPELVPMLDAFGSDLRFLSVAAPGSADETYQSLGESVDGFLQRHDLAHVVYCDPNDVTRGTFADLAETPTLYFPTSVLIDAEHRVVGVWEGFGPQNLTQIQQSIESAIRSSNPGSAAGQSSVRAVRATMNLQLASSD